MAFLYKLKSVVLYSRPSFISDIYLRFFSIIMSYESTFAKKTKKSYQTKQAEIFLILFVHLV